MAISNESQAAISGTHYKVPISLKNFHPFDMQNFMAKINSNYPGTQTEILFSDDIRHDWLERKNSEQQYCNNLN